MDLTMTDQPTRQAIAAQERSGKLTVSGKLKIAIDLMLYEGSCRADAATAAGMTDHGLREAFKKPHVKAYYNAGLEVLRTSTRARNIRRLDSIADTSGNDLAKVAAIKAFRAARRFHAHGHDRRTARGFRPRARAAGAVEKVSEGVRPCRR